MTTVERKIRVRTKLLPMRAVIKNAILAFDLKIQKSCSYSFSVKLQRGGKEHQHIDICYAQPSGGLLWLLTALEASSLIYWSSLPRRPAPARLSLESEVPRPRHPPQNLRASSMNKAQGFRTFFCLFQDEHCWRAHGFWSGPARSSAGPAWDTVPLE